MAMFVDAISRTLRNFDHCVLAYVDDIVIYSKTLEEHYKHLTQVLKVIHDAGLTLNLEESEFMKNEIKFVGFIINQYGVKPNPNKCEKLQTIRTPRKPRDIKSFLGSANYFSKHIPRYAEHASVLNKLTRADIEWRWGEDKELAF